jgi:hypothetical protein
MQSVIAILEDDDERACRMRDSIACSFPDMSLVIFDNAPDMILWLRDSLGSVKLMSLDHDLEFSNKADGDPGTGRDVVDFLIGESPVCPVIIHTSNVTGGDGMQSELQAMDWVTYRILPFGMRWIETEWLGKVMEFLTTD